MGTLESVEYSIINASLSRARPITFMSCTLRGDVAQHLERICEDVWAAEGCYLTKEATRTMSGYIG